MRISKRTKKYLREQGSRTKAFTASLFTPKAFRRAKIYVAAGSPRSGSTLVYNIFRLALQRKYGCSKISCGWDQELKKVNNKGIVLLKTHIFEPWHFLKPNLVVFTYRDPRVSLTSAIRKFKITPTYEMVDHLFQTIHTGINHSDAVFKYEDFRSEHTPVARKIINLLNVDCSVEDLLAEIPKPSTRQGSWDKTTQMHGGHATNTKDEDWELVLPKNISDYMMGRYHESLKSMGYVPNPK